MKRLTALFVSLILMGGSSLLVSCTTQSTNHYYQLPTLTSQSATKRSNAATHVIYLKEIALADYLDSRSIAYQTSDVTYTLTRYHLWGSRLQQQLQQVLITQLNSKLANSYVSTEPTTSDATLSITITAFQGRYDGTVVLKGSWLWQHNDTTISQPFESILPQSGDGYGNLVRTLAIAWQQQCDKIAHVLAANEVVL